MKIKEKFSALRVSTKFIILFYGVTIFSISTIGYYGYTNATGAYLNKAKTIDARYVDDITQKIEFFLKNIPSDLHFITEFYGLIHYLYWQDLKHDKKEDHWKTIVIDTLRNFLDSKDYYFKILFIDNNGIEKIKLHNDRETGKIHIKTGAELQSQQSKAYFYETSEMKKGSIFISELNLSMEYGKIEKPYMPVIRYAQPVIGNNGFRYGVVVINVLADSFLDYIKKGDTDEKKHTFYLINEHGDYLFNPDESKTWGHLIGHYYNFETEYKDIYDKIIHGEKGTFVTGDKIISYNRVYPSRWNKKKYWILVGFVNKTDALAKVNSFKYIFFAIFAIVISFVFIASRYYIRQLLRPLGFITRQLECLGKGEVIFDTINYKSNDEIRQMLDSSNILVSKMEVLANQADNIAAGDFTGSVQVLSEKDRLGGAINNMTKMLRESKEDAQHQNWLKDGINQLNKLMSSELSPQELAEKSISFIARYIEAGHGVFYIYIEKDNLLELLGTYMFTERDALHNKIRMGEGAIGQVGLEKKPILIKNICKEDTIVSTGIIDAIPMNTYTFPIIYESKLQGVIELASFETYSQLVRKFLEHAAEVVATFVYSVLQREQIKTLLKKSEQMASEAKAQSLKLQQANTQMEEQQQELQQQTEELQQANAQMESQQQYLKQQTIEVEQKNMDLLVSKNELDQKAKELELANKYKSEFLANMSHELRTPLNSIILLSKMLNLNEYGNMNEEELKRTEIIHNAGNELLRLINDILDLSKVEAGMLEVHTEEINTGPFLEEVKCFFEDMASENKLDFIIEDSFKGVFTTDKNKLSQIIRNLLSNAFKFTEKGSVTFICERNSNHELPVKFSVIDTGIGIPDDKQYVIFEAFQQEDGSISRQYGGTGLGLSISLRFAKLLGGKIELNSVLGQGSEFSLFLPETMALSKQHKPLPLHNKSDAAHSQETSLQKKDDRCEINSRDLTILLIDDDQAFAQTVSSINKVHGYKTLIALNGQEGLEMAKDYSPHGIILDLGLPDMDGTKVLQELKSSSKLKNIPVCVISAHDKDSKLLTQGAIEFLQKPVTDTQIADAELMILKLSEKKPKEIFVIEGNTLNKDMVKEIITDKNISISHVSGKKDVIEVLKQKKCDLAILEFEQENRESCMKLCSDIKTRKPNLPLIIYSVNAISSEDEASLRAFTDSIILKSLKAKERLIENISQFLFEIPGRESKENQTDIKHPLDENEKKLKNRHIMVVDDDPRNLFVITSALEGQGAKVTNALNGKKALTMLKSIQVDLIFMDIMMPEMDGYEVIQAIRKDNSYGKDIPIIALTAKALKKDKEMCLDAGADSYMTKPVEYELLIKMAETYERKAY